MANQYYPRWVRTRDNVDIVVPNREQHQQHVNYEVGEDGQPVSDQVKEFETKLANADAMTDTVADPDPLGLFQGKE